MSCRLTLGQKTKEVVHVWLAVPAETVLFWGHEEDCATMDQVHWDAWGLGWKSKLMSVFCLQRNKVYGYIVGNYGITYVIS
jgi:hypothetical protein